MLPALAPKWDCHILPCHSFTAALLKPREARNGRTSHECCCFCFTLQLQGLLNTFLWIPEEQPEEEYRSVKEQAQVRRRDPWKAGSSKGWGEIVGMAGLKRHECVRSRSVKEQAQVRRGVGQGLFGRGFESACIAASRSTGPGGAEERMPEVRKAHAGLHGMCWRASLCQWVSG